MLRTLSLAFIAIISTQGGAEWRPAFVLVQPELFSATGGNTNAWADADNDGDLDYFVGFRGRANRFYRNDNGTFVESAASVGLIGDGPKLRRRKGIHPRRLKRGRGHGVTAGC